MKRIMIICLLAVFSLANTHASRELKFVNKDNAFKAVNMIKESKQVIIYCACCENPKPQTISVTKAFFRFSGISEYWNVVVEGTDQDGKKFNQTVDLRSVHIIKEDKLAHPLCLEMGLECDPCTQAFKP